jgi:carboxypeptidase family protein
MRRFASYALHSLSRKESSKSSFPQVALGVLLSILMAPVLWAQAPVGTISGMVTDPSGAVIKDAPITIRSKATGFTRQTKSENDGAYSAPALPAGEYEVQVQMQGFRTILRQVTVTVGAIVKADLALELGQTTEIVTVEAAGASQINYESHSVDGIITRQKIQELPLNGRSFLNLAFLEPGVRVSPGTTSQYNSLFEVSVLGGANDKTAITVDGGNVRNSIEGNTGMNFSQEVVQEFQLSSANYDLSTGITSVGAVNIVTRSGGNEFHGSGYFFFRDHNMAAYPGLKRICDENPTNAICTNADSRKGTDDPFFARRNPGLWVGGPIIKNRLFFFTNYEYTNQVQVFTVQPDVASVAGLAGNFLSPYRGHLFSLKLDLKLNDKHNLFARYSHDQNRGFGPNGGATLPSNWLQNKNFSDQSVLGVTSVFTPTLTNDFRFNYTYWQNRNLFADENTCPGCLGLGFPEFATTVGSNNFRLGNTQNATQGRDLRRFTFLDTLTWQKGSHRMRFGTELEYAPGTGFWGFCDPGCVGVFMPEGVRNTVGAAVAATVFRNVPSVISTNDDLLKLPFAGASVGVGDPSQPPPFNIDQAKRNNRYRLFAQDTWKVKPNFTLNYGLSWNFESTLVNRDLDKPKYLAPLYGNDLGPTDNNYNNFSPSLGFAWNIGSDNKTVVRGGAGIYWETELLWRRLRERASIGPIGNGRVLIPHTAFQNIFPGIIDLTGGRDAQGRPVPAPLPVGAFLPANTITTMTLGQWQQIYNQQIGAMQQRFGTLSNDLSVRNIQNAKRGDDLYPSEYPVQRSYQVGIGVQRQLRSDMVLSVDYVRRVFVNTLLGSIDYNRFNRFINGVQTPVIPRCASAAQIADPNAQCSTGTITFWTPAGRSVYNAMLLKLDKRFSNKYFFTVSYALTGQNGNDGVIDLDDYSATYGPLGSRHILNMSANWELPFGFQVGFISAMASKGAFTPTVSDVDLDGDGTAREPLPGLSYNCFNRGCGKQDLEAAIQRWNSNFYPNGKPNGTTIPFRPDARGRNIPFIDPLPANYRLGDWFSSQDIRLTKKFTWKEHYQIAVFGEMFNVFNVANLSSFNNTVNSGVFGLPTQRQGQVFGSGGPRALQLGARVSF